MVMRYYIKSKNSIQVCCSFCLNALSLETKETDNDHIYRRLPFPMLGIEGAAKPFLYLFITKKGNTQPVCSEVAVPQFWNMSWCP